MASIKIKFIFGIFILALSLVCFAINDNSVFAEVTNHDPRTAEIPQLETFEIHKSILVRLNFDSRTDVSLEYVDADFGLAHTHIGDPPLLRAHIADYNNHQLYSFNSWHPLWANVYSTDGEHSIEILDSASGSFIFPLNTDFAIFKLYDVPLNQELICVNLRPAIEEFCSNNPTDNQCIPSLNSPNPGELSVSESGSIFTLPDIAITIDDDNDPCTEYDPTGTNITEIFIPEWIKNNAAWWAEGAIDDDAFIQGIQFLINENVLQIPTTHSGEGTDSNEIPIWIKNNAAWWAEGAIDDDAFIQGIQFLIKEGILQVT